MNAAAESGMHLTDDELVASTSFSFPNDHVRRRGHYIVVDEQNIPCFGHVPGCTRETTGKILSVPEQLDHDTLVGLPYLDGVVREVLRLYPPVSPVMYREMPSSLSARPSPAWMESYALHPRTQGTSVYIAISAANHNKKMWGEDALEFKPERWTNGKANSVTTKLCGVYGNTMTFIGGGRSCMFQIAQLEMKVALAFYARFQILCTRPRIKWRMTGVVASPHVDNQQQLPIVVERFKA
ncbi:cytochrome P450 [Mycena leptocephala]|nr:cytochrome P450 [Mycena leptocephala]